jgi:hypothetical protein
MGRYISRRLSDGTTSIVAILATPTMAEWLMTSFYLVQNSSYGQVKIAAQLIPKVYAQ